jgi:4-hydroxy-tetrahydrodipicolinate reductase
MNSIHRRPSFQKKIGTGMTPQAFREAIAQKRITGHVGLLESVRMIDAALNLRLDEVEELPPEPVLASADMVTPVGAVGKGGVVGLKSTAVGRMAGQAIVTLDFIAFAGASPEYDEVLIEGQPNLRERIEGGVQGDIGTMAMIMNVVPLVMQTKPGLLTMKDIPCPRNTERVWRVPVSKHH